MCCYVWIERRTEIVDVVIIGGGPAGSILGCYLSQEGIENVIVDKAMHPRPHVGESMVMSTNRILEDIGFLPVMEAERFPRKYGASWHPLHASGQFDVVFAELPQEGIDQDYTYHVDRSRFDLLLLQHARSLGSRVYQGIEARSVLFDESGYASGVRCDVAGSEVDIPARLVVDASGRNTVLGSQLRLREKDTIFDQFAVHGWFEGVNRGTGASIDYIHIYFLPVARGWAWQIPITETVTSMGIVAEKDVFRTSAGRKDDYFAELVAASPDLAAAMDGAQPVTDLAAEADYSYKMRQFAGDGWMLVGDAARFVDPIFSSGVSVAGHSAKFASEAIVEALATGDRSRDALVRYEDRLREGVEVWYEFIRLYYKLLHAFTHLIEKDEYRLQILQLLQGDVYDRSKATALDAMREVISTVESTPGHLWQRYLSDVPID